MATHELAATDAGGDVRLVSRPWRRVAIAAGLFLLGLIDVAILDGVVLPRYFTERRIARSVPVAAVEPAAQKVALQAATAQGEVPTVELPRAVEETPPPTPAPAAEPQASMPAVAARPTLPELAPLLFRRDKVKLEKKVREELAGVLDALRAQPDLHVVLIGHTDDLGSSKVNRRLSARRARIVSYWLQNRGVAPERIEVVGHGAAQPVDDGRTASARARNRRVEIEWRWANQGEP